jgi:hypothetical protein
MFAPDAVYRILPVRFYAISHRLQYIIQPSIFHWYPDTEWLVIGWATSNICTVLEVRKKFGPGVAFIAGKEHTTQM